MKEISAKLLSCPKLYFRFIFHIDAKFAVFAIYNDNSGQLQNVRLTDVNLKVVQEICNSIEAENLEPFLRSLYDLFFKQVEKYLVDNDNLYLCLDHTLPMLSLSATLDYKNKYLFEKYNIINILTPTDIKADFYVPLKDALLMGDPRYNIDKKYDGKIKSLPFAEVEINLIEKMITSSKKFLREEATKDTFYENLDSNIIHISSHGEFDNASIKRLSMPLVGSSILLSGYVDFTYDDKKDGYGNGLLTAEDII